MVPLLDDKASEPNQLVFDLQINVLECVLQLPNQKRDYAPLTDYGLRVLMRMVGNLECEFTVRDNRVRIYCPRGRSSPHRSKFELAD